MGKICNWFKKKPAPAPIPPDAQEKPSPAGVVTRDECTFSSSRFTIERPHLLSSVVTDTNSMEPLFDAGDLVILTRFFDRDELEVGDIVVYNNGTTNVVHRIIEIGNDGSRWYRVKGDNLNNEDPFTLRNSHISHLAVGIIYLKKGG